MTMKHNEVFDLDSLLAKRTVPTSKPDWVNNILRETRLIPQKINFCQEVQNLLLGALPIKPVYLMVTVLSLGVFVGFSSEVLLSYSSINESYSIQYTESLTSYHYGYSL